MGRPSKYKEEYNHQAYIVCKESGFIDTLLAKLFKTTKQTINAWKKQHPKFLDSIKKGKDEHDTGLVENSLLQRATGYEHPEDKIFLNGKTGKAVIVPTIKRYPPDATSLIFWLKNRNPDRWRDKREIEGKLTIEDVVSSLED